MARYCVNCGFPLADENAPVCSRCGAPQPSAPGAPVWKPQADPQQVGIQQPIRIEMQDQPYGYYGGQGPYPPQMPVKKSKKGPVIGIVLGAVGLVVVLVLLSVLNIFDPLNLFGPEASPKGITEEMLKEGFVEFDSDKLLDTVYEMNYAMAGDAEMQQERDEVKDALFQLQTAITTYHATVDYEIIGAYLVSDEKYYQVIDDLNRQGIRTDRITDMAEVDFLMTVTAPSQSGTESQTTPASTVMCIKADNRWYVGADSLEKIGVMMYSL